MHRTPETINAMLRVADYIEEHPNEYDQTRYVNVPSIEACGTTGCIAGWACMLHPQGIQWKIHLYGGMPFWAPADEDWRWIAAHILGLSEDESAELFDSSWQPVDYMTVPEALRKIAFGADISDVTRED